MSNHDREQLEGFAQSLREELRAIPPHRFNAQKIADRTAELARIESRLNCEADLHAAFVARNGGR